MQRGEKVTCFLLIWVAISIFMFKRRYLIHARDLELALNCDLLYKITKRERCS
jgi:hypothetical protein